MWTSILRHYDQHHAHRVHADAAWLRASTTLAQAITRAANATDERGKRYAHQRRIPATAINAARNGLLHREHQLARAHDFDELLAIVTSVVTTIHRAGPLYAYDTTLRISYYRDTPPTRVYLHAGTRAGADRLGLPTNKEFLELHELPVELQDRPADEIEDILCIYKDHFTTPNDAHSCG